MKKDQIIKQVVEFVKQTCGEDRTGHDWEHTYRVWWVAKKIAKKEGADMFVVELGALLHDIADFKFNKGDDKVSSKITKKLLNKLEVDKSIIKKVMYIVDEVSFKGAGGKNEINTIERKIVQDADRLDALGAIGIARTFTYGGHVGRKIHDPNIQPTLCKTFEAYKKSDSSSINHFYEKIFLLKDRMNTKTGKEMAKKRHTFTKIYLKEFLSEWKGTK